ncbi:hypothetical protein [Halorubellus litoreus]|uniref:Phage tail sheath protein n=1 Tax=Halorubellus litoreus TaxID=755308 RepID=A0ABD5VFC3_9EURY
MAIIGQYDPTTGTADPDTVYRITRGTQARGLFGTGEQLTQAVLDALLEGANPVYALTPARQTVQVEDQSAVSGSEGTLDNAPVSENPAKTVFTIDGTEKTTIVTLDDPTQITPGQDEVYLNPVTGDFQLDQSVSSSATVDYEYFDYEGAIDAFMDDVDAVDAVDFLGTTTENEDVADYLVAQVVLAAKSYDFAIAVAGVPQHMDPQTYSAAHNSSRAQVVYPSRNADGESVVGSYLGRRATLGINASPVNKRLRTQDVLYERLSEADQAALIEENVVPLTSERRGSKIVDDPTCVSDGNNEEAAFDYGLARLIMDAVIETIRDNEEPFIGKFNNPKVLKRMQNVLEGRLGFLLSSGAILSYEVYVEKRDKDTADVEVGVTPVAPLRNIYNTVTAGQ